MKLIKPKIHTIHIRIDEATLNRLKKKAESERRSLSNLMQLLIESLIARGEL